MMWRILDLLDVRFEGLPEKRVALGQSKGTTGAGLSLNVRVQRAGLVIIGEDDSETDAWLGSFG